MSTPPSYRVRVGLPHFFGESGSNAGYGSRRANSRLRRSIALSRCLHSLLALARHDEDLLLDIGGRCLRTMTPAAKGDAQRQGLDVEIHVFTDGEHLLHDVLALFRGRIQVHRVALDDPRHLALACRDWLVAAEPLVDLTVYCEDDLVIHDPLFFDKQRWFLRGSHGWSVLMPHRYEQIPAAGGKRLLVDGPLRPQAIKRFYQPEDNVARGRFDDGQTVVFDLSANPHSGMFCINTDQIKWLRRHNLPRSGFIGPLETAATLTVMQYFVVLKPSLAQRDFLWVEHGHPSFLSYLNQWQTRP